MGFQGTKALSDLQCQIMSDDVHNELIGESLFVVIKHFPTFIPSERGRLYAAVSGVHFKSCACLFNVS